jgi:hypothetical protein
VVWSVLFPEFPEVGAFSLVMHTFFALFLPKTNRELFGGGPSA